MPALRWGWPVLVVLLGAGAAAADCPPPAPGEQTLQQGAVQLRWRAEPAVIRVGEPFVLHVGSCPAGLQLVKVDAVMPEHRHGMNYRPTVRPVGDPREGRWRADGLLLHMPGRWRLLFDLSADGRLERLVHEFDVE